MDNPLLPPQLPPKKRIGGKILLFIVALFVVGTILRAFNPDIQASQRTAQLKANPQADIAHQVQLDQFPSAEATGDGAVQEVAGVKIDAPTSSPSIETTGDATQPGTDAPSANAQPEVQPAPIVQPQVQPQVAPKPVAPNGTYTNVDGNEVARPYAAPSRPVGATARCRNGEYSFSQHRRGTCSGNGGVAEWY